MKKYKQQFLQGFEQRNFELIEIATEVPWWVEELWILRKPFLGTTFYVTFLNYRGWESGTKLVEEITVTTSKMKDYQDRASEILSFDMRTGKFNENLDQFWVKLEKKLG